jgi:hypothetical protein
MMYSIKKRQLENGDGTYPTIRTYNVHVRISSHLLSSQFKRYSLLYTDALIGRLIGASYIV